MRMVLLRCASNFRHRPTRRPCWRFSCILHRWIHSWRMPHRSTVVICDSSIAFSRKRDRKPIRSAARSAVPFSPTTGCGPIVMASRIISDVVEPCSRIVSPIKPSSRPPWQFRQRAFILLLPCGWAARIDSMQSRMTGMWLRGGTCVCRGG